MSERSKVLLDLAKELININIEVIEPSINSLDNLLIRIERIRYFLRENMGYNKVNVFQLKILISKYIEIREEIFRDPNF